MVRKTKDAIEGASLRSSVYNVLFTIPRLGGIEAELEYAARSNDAHRFTALLRAYKDLAAELEGLLHQETKHSGEALIKLQKSLTQATAAKVPVFKSGDALLYDQTKNVRRSISEATAAMMTVAARLRSDLEPLQSIRSNIEVVRGGNEESKSLWRRRARG